MINRWIVFAACLLAGGGLGWVFASGYGLAGGAIVGALIWLAFDSFYVSRLLRWIRLEQGNETSAVLASEVPRMPGVWGEAVDRTRRLLKNRDQQLRESHSRLDEFLAAMQASPSGVVLLDAQGRIEWCNHMATQHFGFDAQRDVLQHIANLVREPAFRAYMAGGNFSQDVVIPGSASTPARPVKLSVHVHSYGKDRKLLLSRDITAVELAEAMRRDFVANVSHEIRTPLTV
ncbi:MAG: PAS domain-containing protein, partial [Pseudomonadota bacterium]